MSYCDTCIHHDVCGVEGVDDEATTYCADRIEPCEESISRKAVLDHIYGVNGLEGLELSNVFEKHYADFIKSLPPVTPQPKIGHWIFCEGTKGKDNVEKCSCCQSHWKEAVVYRSDTQEYLRLRLKYCPNCGAKMVEPQESEEV